MHPNPAFRGTERERSLAFVRDRGFGTLAASGPDGPLLSHVPLLLSDDAASADLHLVRSNPLARLDGPTPVTLAVTGPDGYISPDWYGVPDQVPTWNYVAVHLRGRLERLPDAVMRDMLDCQSAAYENRLPKTPWTTAKMTPDVLDRMLRQIVPLRLHIEDVQSTWKLSQNKPDAVRLAAADRVPGGIGQDLSTLSDLMRDLPGAG